MYRTRSHCTNKTRAASTTWLWKRLLARSLHPSSIVYSSMIDVWTCELPRMGYCFKVSQSSSPVADPRHLKISRIYIKFFKNPEALLRPLSAARVLIIVAWGTMADVEINEWQTTFPNVIFLQASRYCWHIIWYQHFMTTVKSQFNRIEAKI